MRNTLPPMTCPTNLNGVPRLLEDLERLHQNAVQNSSDVVFMAGRDDDQSHIYAHRTVLLARCASFQNLKRNEICKIPGTTLTHLQQGNIAVSIKWPQVDGNILKQVLAYIYTGRITLTSDAMAFEALAIGHEMGCEELVDHCRDHIAATLSLLSPLNACQLLSVSIALQNRIGDAMDGCSKSFVDKCTQYIGQNALECLQSSAFLNLSKEAIIRLISSDDLALEEEEVWRAVLNWAKEQAGVTQPTVHWSQEERARVRQQLNGVINHVQILLIDSQVFAEEVEPTGAVPMELSLERYRFAALANKQKTANATKVQPRVPSKLFVNSAILSGDNSQFQKVLNEWYGVPKQTWRLLYRGSSDGFSADSFHRSCDGHAPTYVILMGGGGTHICGGFSDIAWSKGDGNGRGKYVASEKAFLFTLVNAADIPPTLFPISKKMFALVHHPEFGPIFGAGADLSVANNANANTESYSNLPHSYSGDEATCSTLMGDYNFAIDEIEVLTPNNS